MIQILVIHKDEHGKFHLDVDDDISWHEAIGAMHMMIKRVEQEILRNECSSKISPPNVKEIIKGA